MKRVWMTPLAAAGLLMMASGISMAQVPNQPSEDSSHTPQHNSNSGTNPENMGVTGWTGGRQDGTPQSETTGTGAGHGETPGNINNDSFYATGEDLNGPPTQFPANQTPE